jgi:hypothetical protein
MKISYWIEIIIIGLVIALMIFLIESIKAEQVTMIGTYPAKYTFKYDDNEAHREAVYQIISVIATDVANSHVYKLNVFDCTDFSKELLSKLKKKGFNAQCIFGELPNSKGYKLHTWVEVNYSNNIIEVESTGGFIIPDDMFKKDYVIYSKGRCL